MHTCLSPCSGLDMTPLKIVEKAISLGLGMIAITDHNSGENVPAVIAAAKKSGLCVIPGMEITTMEEAHILGLFGSADAALEMQDVVFNSLQKGENNEDLFGMQVISNEFDEVEGYNKRLLIGATSLAISEVVDRIHSFGGIAIAAHIDRGSFSIVSQLGFIPPDLKLDAVEVSCRIDLSAARKSYSEYSWIPFITSSDSHQLEDIGRVYTELEVMDNSFEELCEALRGKAGRRIIYSGG